MSSQAKLIVKRQREISFRSKNSASWNQALMASDVTGKIGISNFGGNYFSCKEETKKTFKIMHFVICIEDYHRHSF
jgi:hypothetical protein